MEMKKKTIRIQKYFDSIEIESIWELQICESFFLNGLQKYTQKPYSNQQITIF